ncbi:type II secretion system protein GspG [Cohnella mopanensis]|uniref:type II secretion system protein GspG n=1 Tax=Cohnella mopanensis TaxID=2911966 RepID=UPI001EF906E4|nr:type II secretion system protein GspG [Cohnella mopanensis]
MELTNSKRHLLTASYIEKKYTEEEKQKMDDQPGGGIQKAHLLHALNLTIEDLSRLIEQVHREHSDGLEHLEELLRISRTLMSEEDKYSNMDLASKLAEIPTSAIVRFAELARPRDRSDSIHVIIKALERRRDIPPVGKLYLERLEVYPVGEERGELMFTVPLAPSESATISHKEWSTSSQEFQEIVQDYFESYSERGVAEKTDSSMSSENESRHANTLNFGASASYSNFGVSVTTSLGLTNTEEERKSAKESMQRNREVTEKASARSRKEHKVTMKLETKKGVEDSSFRTVANPHADKALRIDYYRFMRKWRTDLFRYGLRMTYDITIPTPGARIFARYMQIAELDVELRKPFVFTLQPSDLKESNWQKESASVNATLSAPPEWMIGPKLLPIQRIEYIPEPDAQKTLYGQIEFDVPPGYILHKASFEAQVTPWPGAPNGPKFYVLDDQEVHPNLSKAHPTVYKSTVPRLIGQSGHLTIPYLYVGISVATISLTVTFERTHAHFANWQMASWTTIRAAAEARYHERLARFQAERDRLWIEISGRDTLSLRRLEREELLRSTMLWLVGPSFPLSTQSVDNCIEKVFNNELHYFKEGSNQISPTMYGVTDLETLDALSFGEFVKFIHQAVEWENLLYFLFPYFWGSEKIGREKLFFEHQDPEHQNFLRAGYARIVLTIRPGFEDDFMRLVETGKLSGKYSSPYREISEMVKSQTLTNYSGIPPANPEKHARPLLYPQQRKTWAIMEEVIKALENEKTINGSYPPDLSGLPGAPFKDAWGNDLVYKLPGSGNEYDLISYGANGVEGGEDVNADISAAAGASLIASWYDYTPTSGLDIDVKSIPI